MFEKTSGEDMQLDVLGHLKQIFRASQCTRGIFGCTYKGTHTGHQCGFPFRKSLRNSYSTKLAKNYSNGRHRNSDTCVGQHAPILLQPDTHIIPHKGWRL